MVPADEFENLHVRCFTTALKSGFKEPELDSLIVKEFSKKYKNDFIEFFLVLKAMLGEFINGK